jgi:hypothetical protein
LVFEPVWPLEQMAKLESCKVMVSSGYPMALVAKMVSWVELGSLKSLSASSEIAGLFEENLSLVDL